jgi:hypothetical protein
MTQPSSLGWPLCGALSNPGLQGTEGVQVLHRDLAGSRRGHTGPHLWPAGTEGRYPLTLCMRSPGDPRQEALEK